MPVFTAEQITAMSPQQLAEVCAADMLERETAANTMGITIDAMSPGGAELFMTVAPAMLNGHQTCHGGYIFGLADTAFAYACNSQNVATVAAGCSIEYLAPGRVGDRLRAVARKVALRGKTGVYDVEVFNQNDELLALFRGKSHRIRGAVLANTVLED